MFVATKICSSRQAYFCRDKTFVESRQKLYLWQLAPMIFTRGGCASCLRACFGAVLLPRSYWYPNFAEFAGRCRKARLGMWDITPSIAWKRKRPVIILERTKDGHRQPDEQWDCFQRQRFGETSERRGGALMGFTERIDTILN